jgi:hypothetical protein
MMAILIGVRWNLSVVLIFISVIARDTPQPLKAKVGEAVASFSFVSGFFFFFWLHF